MKVTLILAATSPKLGIGKQGGLPWRLKKEMKYFRQVTQGSTVVMGRKTWESIPPKFRPLPNRENIVISRQKLDLGPDVRTATSIEEALKISQNNVFIIGGGEVYRSALKYANYILLTLIDDPNNKIECDTFFSFDKHEFEQQTVDKLIEFVDAEVPLDGKEVEGDLRYEYTLWKRI